MCRAFCKLQYRLRPSRYQSGAGVFRLLQAETGDGALWVQAGRVTMVPFRDTELALPGGPAAPTLKSDSALLPVFTERNENGPFIVTIEAPLDPGPDEAADASRKARVAAMLTRKSALTDDYFRRLPSQYHFSHLHIETGRLRKHPAGAAGPDTP